MGEAPVRSYSGILRGYPREPGAAQGVRGRER